MPLDKVLVSHLDEMDKIEDALDEIIERLVDNIDINAVITDPLNSLGEVTAIMIDLLDEDIYKDAVKNGIELANAIRKDGDIKIQRADDPNKNEGQL
jgi:hypothetical protein